MDGKNSLRAGYSAKTEVVASECFLATAHWTILIVNRYVQDQTALEADLDSRVENKVKNYLPEERALKTTVEVEICKMDIWANSTSFQNKFNLTSPCEDSIQNKKLLKASLLKAWLSDLYKPLALWNKKMLYCGNTAVTRDRSPLTEEVG